MTLNEVKGNMYDWINYTWNPISGRCQFECDYCYCKRFPRGELRLREGCFKDNLGEKNTIFIGSSTDMFAPNVQSQWIKKVLEYCKKFQENTYVFQSKNPKRFKEFKDLFPDKTFLGTTIETNRDTGEYSYASLTEDRTNWLKDYYGFNKFVTIEPIMDFDVEHLTDLIKEIKPNFINIGADSKNSGLPEPSKQKIEGLIKELKKFTKVNIKDNLKRLMK
jgi:protein gp37